MADRIQQRRDTSARWAEYNPILLEGEMGIVTDNPNQYKIGDGVHAWNELPLRGFDGTLVHELGDSENAAMSQKGVTKKIEELTVKTNRIDNDLSAYSPLAITGETITSYISAISKTVVTDGDNSNILIPVDENLRGKQIKVVPSEEMLGSLIVFLKSKNNLTLNGGTPDLCNNAYIESIKTDTIYIVPTDCNYIYVSNKIGEQYFTPKGLYILTGTKIEELTAKTNRIDNDLSAYSPLTIAGETITSYISATSKTVVTDGDNSNILIPVDENLRGKQIKVVPSEEILGSLIAFLKSKNNLTVNGGTPDLCNNAYIESIKTDTIYIVPTDCNYIYVSNKIGEQYFTPKGLYILTGTKIEELTVKTNRIDNDLSAYSPLAITGETITSYISAISKTVVTDGDNSNILIPVDENLRGKQIYIDYIDKSGAAIAFLKSKNNLTVNGGTPDYCLGETCNAYTTNEILNIPSDCNYIYISNKVEGVYYAAILKMINIDNVANDYTEITPISVIQDSVISIGQKKVITLPDSNKNYRYVVNKYRIEKGVVYFADIRSGANIVDEYASVGYFDINNSFLGYEYPVIGISKVAKFYKLNIPDNTAYVYLHGAIDASINLPLKPKLYSINRKNKSSVVAEQLYYYVTKVSSNILENIDGNTSKIEDNIVDSAWGIKFPKSYSSNGAKTQIIAMLHGSIGVVTPEILGYDNNGWKNWQKLYLDAGYAVMDVNGYGISLQNDQKSQHWGNPASVQTLKNAFEHLKSVFNVNDKLILQGSSIGGLLSISYALTYPNDVLCVGNFSPATLCRMAKFEEGGGSYAESTAIAWGYETAQQIIDDKLSKFVGYDLLMKALFVKNGQIQDIDWGEFDCDSYLDDDSTKIISRFNIPYRIWVGENDNLVPPRLVKMIIRALRNGGCNATYRIYNGVGHGMCSGNEYVQELYEEALEWYKIIK